MYLFQAEFVIPHRSDINRKDITTYTVAASNIDEASQFMKECVAGEHGHLTISIVSRIDYFVTKQADKDEL